MIPTRIAEHIKAHNWFAVAIDFVIVVVGVVVGLQVNNWSAARDRSVRTARVIEAVRRDLRDANDVETSFGRGVDAALAEFDAARRRNEYPPPVFMRIPGSDTPPRNVWQAVLQSQLADLIDPGLLFELGFYYDERDGLGAKFVRYTEFTETEILPRLKEDSRMFYTQDGSQLAPMFEAHMDRLRERRKEWQVINKWASCLDDRLNKPRERGTSCRPSLGYGMTMPGSLTQP